jgi:hypothetical protein
VVAGTVVGAGACNSLLDVELPGRLIADRLDDPSMVPVQMVGMLSDFECGFQGHALTGSILSEEFFYVGAGGRVTLVWVNRLPVISDESHAIGCEAVGGVFLPLHTARFQAEDLFARVEGFPEESVANREDVLGTAAAVAGYSITLLGEAFCEMTIDAGPLMTRQEVFERAEVWFTRALEHATSDEIRNMAYVGRARTRLNLGDGEGAVADASQIPEGFAKLITTSRSTSRRENTFYGRTHESWTLTVPPAYRDLEVDGVPDPRVQAVLADHLAADATLPLWLQLKYTSHTDPLVLAGWREAQLIIAEVRGGQEAVAAINRLRASVGLPLFQSADDAEIAAQVLEERRRELYLQGNRHGDMLRLGIPFSTGTTIQGEPLGDITCIPLPNLERATNPNL